MNTVLEQAPGARLRGKLNWLILKTLAVDIGVPLAVGELVQILYLWSSQSLSQAFYRINHPCFIRTYFDRLVEKGCIRLEGVRRKRQATLTPAGRRALHALEQVIQAEGDRRWLEAGNHLAVNAAHDHGRQGRRIPQAALLRRMDRRQVALLRRIPGKPRADAFVSYDLPRSEERGRRLVIAVLKGHGFKRLHQSMYVGPSERLRGILESLEPFGVVPFLRWGTLSVFHP
jgi:DNA-binding transcriptional regulator PaaX